MTTPPLDPAAIKAEHEGHFPGCATAGDESDGHCLPYCLAAELVEAQTYAAKGWSHVKLANRNTKRRTQQRDEARAELVAMRELKEAFEGAAADLAQAGIAERDALRKVIAIQERARAARAGEPAAEWSGVCVCGAKPPCASLDHREGNGPDTACWPVNPQPSPHP